MVLDFVVVFVVDGSVAGTVVANEASAAVHVICCWFLLLVCCSVFSFFELMIISSALSARETREQNSSHNDQRACAARAVITYKSWSYSAIFQVPYFVWNFIGKIFFLVKFW
jgi:hypothetical protein